VAETKTEPQRKKTMSKFTLKASNDTIEVFDENGKLRAEVWIDLYNDIPRAVISWGILEDEPVKVRPVINLLTGEIN
jgi:hypothetical protein